MYNYEAEKPNILTDQGQRELIKVLDKTRKLLKESGVVRMDKIMPSGSSWLAMAYVDRLVEIGIIKELHQADAPGQHRVFVSAEIE